MVQQPASAKEFVQIQASVQSLNKTQLLALFDSLVTTLVNEQGTPSQELYAIITSHEFFSVPVDIFNSNLSPLEAIVFFLKEQHHHPLHQIAQLLKRDDRTIWTTYHNAKKKRPSLPTTSTLLLPLSIFSDRKLSVLEHVVSYLRETLQLTNKQIAQHLGKDNKTIWTVYNRALKKKAAMKQARAESSNTAATQPDKPTTSHGKEKKTN